MSEVLTVYAIAREVVLPIPGFEMPHDRIVGVDTPEGQTLWTPQPEQEDSEAAFAPEDARAQQLPFAAPVSARFVSFFRRFQQPDSDPSDYYNGSGFAQWLLGDEECVGSLEAFRRGYERGKAIIEHGELTERHLKLGELGMFGTSITVRYREGTKKMTRELYFPQHAVIGLGEDSDTCLQVLSSQGHIAIATYDRMRDFGKHGLGPYSLDRYGLYVPRPEEPELQELED